MESESLNWKVGKILAKQENLSRREAERWIEQGLVYFEGKPITACSERMHKDSKLQVCVEQEQHLPQPITLLYHKPLGQLSAPPKTKNYPLAQECIEEENYYGTPLNSATMRKVLDSKQELRCPGRLDIHSKGLLLLSSDMTVVRALLNSDKEQNPIEKIYIVRAHKAFSKKEQKDLIGLKELEGQALLPFSLDFIDSYSFKLTLIEGKKHQIRKMLKAVGNEAAKIKRVAIGPFSLGKLPKGHWRLIDQKEIEKFLTLFKKTD